MGRTRYFDLSTLAGDGTQFSDDGYKYTNADRETIATLLHMLVNHDHSGGIAELDAPEDPPNLELNDDITDNPTALTGSLQGDQRIFYRYSIVDPEGLESMASPEAFVDTPVPFTSDNAPTLSRSNTGGTLRPGSYFYVLTAWADADTLETLPSPAATTTLPNSGSTQRIILDLPGLPSGADGFNIYRRIPGSTTYHHLHTTAGFAAQYIDTGGVEADCERLVPIRATIGNANMVGIELPYEDPLEAGYTWRVYRSFDTGQWNNTLLANVVEETEEASGITTSYFIDVGNATGTGTPPETSLIITRPPPVVVDLADAIGILPEDQMSQIDIDVGTYGQLPVARLDGDFGGDSAYDIAVAEGFVGDEEEWLESLKGKTAYQIAVDNGYLGDEETWLLTLNGSGASAYQIAVNEGFTGTQPEWLASLTGYAIAVQNGFVGTQAEWLDSLVGKTNYQIAVDNGFVGDEADWLASIEPADGESAYQIALNEGFVGTEADWLESLIGGVATAVDVNLQTGTTYTLQLSDAGKVVERSNAAANTVTIPEDSAVSFPIGTIIEVCQINTGQTSITHPGVSVLTPNGLKIAERYGTVALRKRNTNEWILAGYLEP